MGAKGASQKKPRVTGLDEINVDTSETNVPPTYFAGVRKLNVSWITIALIDKIKASGGGGK